VKIVSKAELMQMPKGTPFADYPESLRVPWPEGPEMILYGPVLYGDDEPRDFFFTTISSPEAHDTGEMIEREDRMVQRGASFPVDLVIQREGLYDATRRYLVWEPDDVRRIINLLQGGDDERDDE
jgi:hypothetical protein